MSFFEDINGTKIIKEKLLDSEAEKLAKAFLIQPKKENKREKALTSAQIRKFYSDFKQLEKKVNVKGFEQTLPFIKMMKSKASYASNPGNQKIPTVFKKFLLENVDEIKTKDDFHAFMLHFEAVVGFFFGLDARRIN